MASRSSGRTISRNWRSKFCPVYLRNATAYGVSPKLRFDLVLNNLVAFAMTTGQVLMKSDGTPWRPIVHIRNISRAFLALMTAPTNVVFNQAFNVGINEENYRIHELADMVKEVVPNCKIEFAPGAGPDKRCYRVDCGKINRWSHRFKPQWTARKGVRQLYDAYRAVNLTLEDFQSTRYSRIDYIRGCCGTSSWIPGCVGLRQRPMRRRPQVCAEVVTRRRRNVIKRLRPNFLSDVTKQELQAARTRKK